jgi:SpoVK/Ycf46/Vps4 family AAA+-type ATPase
LKEIKVSDEPDTSTSSSSSSSSRLPTNKKNFTIVLSESKKDSAGLDHIHAFMEECIKDYDAVLNRKLKDNRQYLFEFKGSDNEDGQLTLKYSEHLMEHNKDLNTNIFFEAKQRLIQYIQPFVYDETNVEGVNEGEKQYNKTGFTFKAGLLFYGSPGCGKTSTIKAILKYTKRHGIIINLSKVKTCEELEYLFRNREINKRKLVGKQLCFILEDCDASEDSIVQSRELIQAKHRLDEFLKEELNPVSQVIEITKQEMASNLIKPVDKINLSCFLNVLDGIIELHGVMIIMTTNYPDKIDAALIRPGRFDFKHEFKKATKQIIIDMLTFRYGLTDETTIKSLSSRLKVGNEVLSPAEIQSICFKNENIFDAIKEINEIKH